MVRFEPDGWLEALLRPLILLDPQAGVYFEDMAPDGRFAALAILALVVAFNRKRSATLTHPQRQLAWAFLAVFFVWTFAVGNGRYFITGLMLAGPLLVAAWSLLPGTLAFRWLLLTLICALQLALVTSTYLPNRWGLVRWEHGDGIPIEPTPLRQTPSSSAPRASPIRCWCPAFIRSHAGPMCQGNTTSRRTRGRGQGCTPCCARTCRNTLWCRSRTI
jgi:hypothetical protein